VTTVAEAVASGILPERVWLYSNYHCNLACSYCLTESSPSVRRRELSAEHMIELARQAAELGFASLGVTGGEPFLVSDMASTLARLGSILPTIALTNGTLFTGARLRATEVLAGGDVALQISLDSADPDVNDEARGPHNFAKVVAAVPALVARGVTVRIATTGESLDPEDMARLCALHRDLGVPDEDHVVRPILSRGRAAEAGLGVAVSVDDLPAELTLTADGAYWSPFGPTVQAGRLDTDLLLTRTIDPVRVPAAAMLRLAENQEIGSDTTLNIR
jgi:MoaA/NifB/PqqE/SkfB family radical SAM enzyme